MTVSGLGAARLAALCRALDVQEGEPQRTPVPADFGDAQGLWVSTRSRLTCSPPT